MLRFLSAIRAPRESEIRNDPFYLNSYDSQVVVLGTTATVYAALCIEALPCSGRSIQYRWPTQCVSNEPMSECREPPYEGMLYLASFALKTVGLLRNIVYWFLVSFSLHHHQHSSRAHTNNKQPPPQTNQVRDTGFRHIQIDNCQNEDRIWYVPFIFSAWEDLRVRLYVMHVHMYHGLMLECSESGVGQLQAHPGMGSSPLSHRRAHSAVCRKQHVVASQLVACLGI